MSERRSVPTSAPTNANAAESDLTRLISYMKKDFPRKHKALLELLQQIEQLSDKHDLVRLGVRSQVFVAELNDMVEVAAKVLAQQTADVTTASYEITQQRASEFGSTRAPAPVLAADTEGRLAPLVAIVNLLKSTRELWIRNLSWCQSQQKAIHHSEFGEAFMSNADLPEDIFESAIGETLREAQAFEPGKHAD